MRKTFLTAIISTILVLSGCAVSTTTMDVLQDKTVFNAVKVDSITPYITSGNYVQRANNLFVVFDASSSTTEDYEGEAGYKANNLPNKLEVQREVLHRINQTIADSASSLKPITTSIRSFGYGYCDQTGDTYLHQAPTSYSKEAFNTAVDTIACSHGRSHITEALDKTDADLSGTKGNISLLIVSDGLLDSTYSLGAKGDAAVAALKQKYGDRLCVYNVWTGQESEESGRDELVELTKIASAAACGQPYSVTAERVSTTDGMKDFVRALLLTPVPKPPAVNIDCSQLDSDGDGVNDCNDKCPNTIKGTPVNRLGCWIVDVKFDNDRSEIKPQYFALLDKLATDITANFANLTIEVQGHTSNTASAAHNLKLSVRRANAVADYLNKRIRGPHKLVPHGYGLTRPIDTNETEAGRANNRRVQLEVLQ
ncbi:MAG: OmpA family protein [Methylococcales bacterium]|nr:OmpA family protein [Methylococcales bacterium]